MKADENIQPSQPHKHGAKFYFHVTQFILIFLVIVSLVGIGISDFSQKYGFYFWLGTAPVFGLASLIIGWSHARHSGQSWFQILGKQLFHWLALALVMCMIYLFQYTGRLNNTDAGIMAMMALSLTTFLAGVHFDWRFYLIGIFLGGATIAIAFIEQFFWLMLIPIAIIVVILIYKMGHSNHKTGSLSSDEEKGDYYD